MQEQYLVSKWLYKVLHDDPGVGGAVGGRIYESVAPQGAAFPAVVFASLSDRDIQTHNEVRVFIDSVYLVEVICEGEGYGPVANVADRIDELLDQSPPTPPTDAAAIAGLYVLSSSRQRTSKRATSSEEGTSYRQMGGQYRIRYQGV